MSGVGEDGGQPGGPCGLVPYGGGMRVLAYQEFLLSEKDDNVIQALCKRGGGVGGLEKG